MIKILRLGHRVGRDPRITTHVCLVARALGADGVILSGERDDDVVRGVEKVVENWGGKFSVEYCADWKGVLKEWKTKRKGKVVHLTMYGELVQDVVSKIRKEKRLLVVVGAGKVPGEVYRLSDYNVSVTNQPHSEVGALAVFLHEVFRGKELGKKFNGKIRILPQKIGKSVVSCE